MKNDKEIFLIAQKYQALFDLLYNEHGIILTISEMDEIIIEVNKIDRLLITFKTNCK